MKSRNSIKVPTSKRLVELLKMMKWFSFVFSTFGLCSQVFGINKYTDYTLLQVVPYNSQQLKALNEIIDDSENVDFFKRSHGPNDTSDIFVSPSKRAEVEALAKMHGMGVHHKPHYGRFINREAKVLQGNNNNFMVFDYNSYDAIQAHIQSVATRSRGLVRIETLCTSYEGRIMKLIKFSSNHRAGYPIIFIDAGAHAREWAAPAFAMYILERLTQLPASELGGVDWYILPVVNPDGYEYTRKNESNRMWRKTRSKTWRKGCFGVDINRNFGYKWGYAGVSFDPCEFQVYAGRKPFSERESRIVRKVLLRYSKRIKLYLSIHTYGDYIIYPWSYTGEGLPPVWQKVHKLAKTFSNAVEKAGGKPFKVMSAGQWYPSAGASIDFAYARAKIDYSFVLEITDGHEFIFPANLLRDIFIQYYEGLIALSHEIKKEFAK